MSATIRAPARSRPRPNPRIRWGRATAAFLVTAALVYGLGRLRDGGRWPGSPSDSAAASHTATAAACWQTVISPPSATPGARWAETARIREQALSDEFLTKALRRASTGAGDRGRLKTCPTVEDLRSALDVAVRTDAAERVEVSFAYSGSDASDVTAVVNCLAEQAAEEQRAAIEAAARRDREAAQADADRAGRQLREAQAEFTAFLEDHFRAPQPNTDETLPTPSAAPAPPKSAAPSRPASENPEWGELNGQVKQIRQQLDALRLDRTPAHPAVQELERRLVETEKRLASARRELPQETANVAAPDASEGPGAPPATASGTPSPVVRQSAAQRADVLRVYQQHREALARALQSVERSEAVERQTWARQPAALPVALRLAEAARPDSTGASNARLLLAVLAASLTVAVGVLMVSTGWDLDPPLTTADEAKAWLPVPVVGTVRVADRTPQGAPRRRLAAERLGWMIAGSTLIAACAALVSQAL